MRNARLVTSCSTAAMIVATAAPGTSAWAQGIATDDGAASRTSPAGIEYIVVTAQRREETVQRSSLSISVLDTEALESVTDAKDIATLVPGVQISQGGSTLQAYVRGIGDFGSSALNQSAVSFNIDGAYTADTSTVSPQFYDLARVEVLKGPQGTLYGRNASAGAVNLVYRRPELGLFGAEALVELGNYEAVRAGGTVNIPVGQRAALRGSVNYIDRDGYLSDGTNDDEQVAGRAQILFEPTDAISLRIAGDAANRTGRGPGSVLIPRQPGNGKFTGGVDPQNNAARLAVNPFAFTPGAGLPPVAQTGLLNDTFVDHRQRNVGAEVNWDLRLATLTFLPYYRSSESSIGTYQSGGPFLNQEDVEQKSYELRLSHDADWGNAIVGAYYLDLDQTTAAQVYQATFIIAEQAADLGTESIAGFGQATLDLTDALRLIAGARYTAEDRSIDANDISNSVLFANDVSFRRLTWRGGVEYDITPENMAYAVISKGFKSGGFNVFAPTPTVTNAYEPETLYSYALGVRNRFLENRVQFNVEGFYWDYRDSQQNALEFTPAGDLQFSTFNAASAILYGFDADFIVRPTPADTFTATLAFLHTEFDEFILNPPFPTDPAANGCLLNNTTPPFSIDCSGFRLPRAPRWSGAASYQHVFEVGQGNDLSVSASMDFATERSLGINYVSNEQADSFVRFNAEATYGFADRHSVTVFVRNITNEEIPIAGNQAGLTPNLIYAQVAPPRTYGIRLVAKF